MDVSLSIAQPRYWRSPALECHSLPKPLTGVDEHAGMGTGLTVGPGSGVCVPLRPGVGLTASLVGVAVIVGVLCWAVAVGVEVFALVALGLGVLVTSTITLVGMEETG